MTTSDIQTWRYRVKINGTWEGDAMKLEIDDLRSALQSQAERIAELERESETHSKAYGLAIVERDNLRHELKTAQEGWRCECSTDDACRFARERDALRAELGDLPEAQAEMLAEIKRLRAELDAIDAAEPVAYRWVWKSKPHDIEGWCYTHTPPNHPELQEIEKLFTRPMPAQDVKELVEALDWCIAEINRDSPAVVNARTALSNFQSGEVITKPKDFPAFPCHPEPRIMKWSELEIETIQTYAKQYAEALGRKAK